MKQKIFLLSFFLLFFCFLPVGIKADTTKLLQHIEIIKQEISLLQQLFLNMQLKQEITASSYLVINLSNDSVLLKKNTNYSYPTASVTKLMTAVIALENIDMKRKITLTEKMLQPYGYSPSLYLNLSISAENLLKASLIQSVNDAAEALTYFIKEEDFLSLMNQKAKELGMINTVFYDSHGLNPDNVSTAQDLAELLTYVYKNHQEILNITRDNDFWLPDSTGRLLKFRNLNDFYPFSTFIGGKTGYLPEAKETFASIFNLKDDPIAIILLYSENRQADIFTILEKLKN